MNLVGLSALSVALLAGCSSMPGAASKDAEEHRAYAEGNAAAPAPAGYDQQMKMMQEMHQKMAAVRSPEERAALMQDHMNAMQGGMGMMKQMHAGMMAGQGTAGDKGAMSMNPETMRRCMDMMGMTMQLMMDREGMEPPAPK